jgi:predicted nucleic acid-binding protein
LPSAARALCDSGPLIALFDRSDESHESCGAALARFSGSFVTSWPVLTEAFHFIDRRTDRRLLWDFVLSGVVRIDALVESDVTRMRVLMEQYSDLPMDFADASLVALSERLRVSSVFTLDRRGFSVFRTRYSKAFEIFP